VVQKSGVEMHSREPSGIMNVTRYNGRASGLNYTTEIKDMNDLDEAIRVFDYRSSSLETFFDLLVHFFNCLMSDNDCSRSLYENLHRQKNNGY
jgi:hypothetical protein